MDQADGWGVSVTARIDADPARIWSIVADVTRHPELAGSSEIVALRLDGPVKVGTVFESDIRTGEAGSFTTRCVVEAATEPTLFAWVSYPPLDDDEIPEHQIEVHWSFALASVAERVTELRHEVRIPRPTLGADELGAFFERTGRLDTVRAGMEQTLANVQAAAEAR